MFIQTIKKLMLPAFLLFAGTGLRAQQTAGELAGFSDKVTEVVKATLETAAEKNITDVGTMQDLLRRATGDAESGDKGGVMNLQTFVNERLCDAPPAVRAYFVRVKDILLPTTGPTYPQDVVVAFRTLESTIQGDRELSDETRGQLLAYVQGLSKFVVTLQELHDKYPDYFDRDPGGATYKASGCKSWWCRWGKCAAAVVGGAMVGGLGGAVGGSTVPVIGTVAGGVVGTIGGGLAAAGQYCD